MMDRKCVREHFHSINGEVNPLEQGSLQYFVRFQGCNLRCFYCDTKESTDNSEGNYSIRNVKEALGEQPPAIINFTGGEPLLFSDSIEWMVNGIRSGGYGRTRFIIKSNGTLPIGKLKSRLNSGSYGIYSNRPVDTFFALDYKQGCGAFNPVNFGSLDGNDTLNFPVTSEEECIHALNVITMYKEMEGKALVCMSPIGDCSPKDLLDFMIRYIPPHYEVLMNIQLHKQANLR